MRLNEYMASRELNDGQMAALIGCDRSYVVKLRAGKIPSPEVIETIAKETGGAVQPNDWFDGLPEAADAA